MSHTITASSSSSIIPWLDSRATTESQTQGLVPPNLTVAPIMIESMEAVLLMDVAGIGPNPGSTIGPWLEFSKACR